MTAIRTENLNISYGNLDIVKDLNINVGTGKFGAHMMVDLTNDGPVTILLEK